MQKKPNATLNLFSGLQMPRYRPHIHSLTHTKYASALTANLADDGAVVLIRGVVTARGRADSRSSKPS
eukprot:m.191311 g.191311  ORF g.191311 m.191311 type:complete len:68 (+) comp14836_c0_seq1:1664-1867(+)